jgi:threonine synthase
MQKDITGYHFTDEETKTAMVNVLKNDNYILDPHGAVGYLGLKKYQQTNTQVTGIFLETAHPGKFKEVVEEVLAQELPLPDKLNAFLSKEKKTIAMSNDFGQLKLFLLQF